MTRKLATVQRIKELLPIAGADRIEAAVINGWQTVVKKGDFKVGEMVVFVEIDAFVPHTVAPFLTEAGKPPKEFNGVEGQRLKTKKLRKTLSQGLVLPVLSLPAVVGLMHEDSRQGVPSEGRDVTEALGIQLWESPEEHKEKNGANQQASKTRSFPYFLKKTDQERVQNYGHMVVKALDEEFEVTVKKDGSSMTVFRVDPSSKYYKDAKRMTNGKLNMFQRFINWAADIINGKEAVYGICSRNLMLPLYGDSNFHKAAVMPLEALRKLDKLGKSYAIQGEVVAPDIQGNYEKVEKVEFHMFDMFLIDEQEYAMPTFRRQWAADFGVRHATVVDKGTLRNILQLKEGEDVVQKALTYASGEGDNAGVAREGVVFKAEDRDFSFKCVSNEYLLAKDK